MSAPPVSPDPDGHLARRVVDELVADGCVAAEDRRRAEAVVREVVGQVGHAPGTPAPGGLGRTTRARLGEVAGYLGGALVASAAVVFLADQWAGLSDVTRIVLLGGTGLTLAIAGAAVRGPGEVRRRLASTLLTMGAGSLAAMSALAVDEWTSLTDEWPGLIAMAVLLVLGLAGYRASPSAWGQVPPAFGGLVAVFLAGELVAGSVRETAGTWLSVVFLLVLGAAWAGAAEIGRWWREPMVARFVGCGLVLLGAQAPLLLQDSLSGWAYVATGAVAAGGFAVYLTQVAWPYLALGMVATTLVVPEAVTDLTDGAVGPAGALLVAGASLLIASLLALRLRREVSAD